MATDIHAKLSHCGVSAQKARLVVDLIRGKQVNEAMNTLHFANKVAARHIEKLLASAIANGEENFGSVEMIFMYTASQRMKHQPANGVDLEPVVDSNRFYGVHLISTSFYVSESKVGVRNNSRRYYGS